MKASHRLGSVKAIQRHLLSWVVALCLTGGILIPYTTQAASSEAEVPFTKALADARQVANMNNGWKVYVGRGESMLPQIGHNALLLVARADFDQLTEGMLVIYRDQAGDLVSHRLIGRTSKGWIAKGINNYREDPGMVTRDNLQGIVFGQMSYQAGTDNLAAMAIAQRPAVAYAKSY